MAFIMNFIYFVSAHLKRPLEYYMSRYKKVRIICAKQRVGSIRARTLAMSAATAPVIIVLDSHCECFPGKNNYFIPVFLCYVIAHRHVYMCLSFVFIPRHTIVQRWTPYIMKTCLYNFDALKPKFCIPNWSLHGYTLSFLSLLENINCGYSLEPLCQGGSNEYPKSMF